MAFVISLEQVKFTVQQLPDGTKHLLFQDPDSSIIVGIPMAEADAQKLADVLTHKEQKLDVVASMPESLVDKDKAAQLLNREQRRSRR